MELKVLVGPRTGLVRAEARREARKFVENEGYKVKRVGRVVANIAGRPGEFGVFVKVK